MAERTRRAYGIDAGQLALWCTHQRPRPRRRDPARAAALRAGALRAPRRPRDHGPEAGGAAPALSRPARARRGPREPGRSRPRAEAARRSCRASWRPRRSPRCSTASPRRRRWSSATAPCSSSPTRAACARRSSSTSTSRASRSRTRRSASREKAARPGIVPAGEDGAARRRALARARPSGAAERRRRPGAVPLQERPPAVHVGRPAAPAVMGATGRDPGRDLAARAAPFVRDAPPGRRRRPAGDPGAAGPQLREHDADLHSGRVCAPEVRLHPSASPRLKRFDAGEGSLWTRTSRPSSSRICGGATRPLRIRLPVSASSSRIRRS